MTTLVRITRELPSAEKTALVLEFASLGDESPRASEAKKLLKTDPLCARLRETLALEGRGVMGADEQLRPAGTSRVRDCGLGELRDWLNNAFAAFSDKRLGTLLAVLAQELLRARPAHGHSIYSPKNETPARVAGLVVPELRAHTFDSSKLKSLEADLELLVTELSQQACKSRVSPDAIREVAQLSLSVYDGAPGRVALGLTEWFEGDPAVVPGLMQDATQFGDSHGWTAAALYNLSAWESDEGRLDSSIAFAKAALEVDSWYSAAATHLWLLGKLGLAKPATDEPFPSATQELPVAVLRSRIAALSRRYDPTPSRRRCAVTAIEQLRQ